MLVRAPAGVGAAIVTLQHLDGLRPLTDAILARCPYGASREASLGREDSIALRILLRQPCEDIAVPISE